MNALKAAGAVPKWGAESPESGAAGTARQNKFNGELRMAGIKQPDQLATPSVRNDAAFLFTVTGGGGRGKSGWTQCRGPQHSAVSTPVVGMRGVCVQKELTTNVSHSRHSS